MAGFGRCFLDEAWNPVGRALQASPLSQEILIAVAVDRDKVLQAAQKLVERKRYDKAIVEYQKLTAEDPKDVRTLLKIGDLYLKMEEYVDAITTYERVGEFYSVQGHASKAIAVYKQIVHIINKHVPHLEDRFGHIIPRLAEMYAQLGLTSDALVAYDEVATRLQRAGRDRDAIDVFRKIVDLDPNNPLTYLRLADALVRVRDFDNAIKRFGTAAEILLKLGRRDDALKVVERLLQHRTDARFARMAAEIYLDRGSPSDRMAALAKLQISFKENPKDLETLTLLARAFDLLNQPAKAIEVQKESARIAKETGRLDQFAAIVASLTARAPNDEGVRQLAAQHAPPPSVEERTSIPVLDEDIEPDPDDLSEVEPAPVIPAPPREPQAVVDEHDPAALARQIIGQAEELRRSRRYDKALAVLKSGIQRLPSARDIRQKTCDLLLEAGDQEGAIEQMLAFAEHLSIEGDADGAARVLEEVLLLEPGQAQATEMLVAFGYSVPDEGGVDQAGAEDAEEISTSEILAEEIYDPNAPLPSYDLEEVGAAQALSRQPDAIADLDDPFANEPPLPSYPLEEHESRFRPASIGQASASSSHPPAHSPYTPYTPTPAPPSPAVAASPALDEDALEEVEFFAQNGMFDDARNILEEQLSRLPNHPLLLERLREVESLAEQARAAADLQSGARPRFASEHSFEDRAFDIAESLEALDQLERAEGPSASGLADDPSQISVESLFEQFKLGIKEQISESDAATHYDLGLAYRDMGLYPDAISEFELASRDPGRECVCQSLIGAIHMQIGNIDAAIDAFIRGLQASQKTVEQELALTYEIGSAYEMRGVHDQALYYFQRVARMNPNYNDPRGTVADRIRRLEVPKPAARAVGAEMISNDEFDAAFDDLLTKLP